MSHQNGHPTYNYSQGPQTDYSLTPTGLDTAMSGGDSCFYDSLFGAIQQSIGSSGGALILPRDGETLDASGWWHPSQLTVQPFSASRAGELTGRASSGQHMGAGDDAQVVSVDTLSGGFAQRTKTPGPGAKVSLANCLPF